MKNAQAKNQIKYNTILMTCWQIFKKTNKRNKKQSLFITEGNNKQSQLILDNINQRLNKTLNRFNYITFKEQTTNFINPKNIYRKKMYVIVPAVKTINAKYFKSITNVNKDWAQKFNLPSSDGLHLISPFHYLQHFSVGKSIFHEKPHSLIDSALNVDFMNVYCGIQQGRVINHNDEQATVTEKEQQTTNHSANSLPQVKLTISEIQTLQFESNNPIEDRLVCQRLQSIDALTISVFDGHGGSMLADYAAKKVNELMNQYLLAHLNSEILMQKHQTINLIKSAIQHAYDHIEERFYQLVETQVKTGNKEFFKIGSCALTAVIYKDSIVVANCGDSQGIVVMEDNNNRLSYFATNQQLNTSNQQQINRIQQQFKAIDTQVLSKSKRNNKLYIKGILQPTRTLGDHYLKKEKYFRKVSHQQFKGPYITHKPQFRVIDIKASFKHLIIASDGLWDFATKDEIIKVIEGFISKQQQNLQIIQQLTQKDLCKTYNGEIIQTKNKLTLALRDFVLDKCASKQKKTQKELMQMKTGLRRNYCDDISIAVVNF